MNTITKSLTQLSLATIALVFSQIALADFPIAGQTEDTVIKEYGQPINRLPAVGEPPITRWIYNDFTVVFEYNRVVHAFKRIAAIEGRSSGELPPRAKQASKGTTITLPQRVNSKKESHNSTSMKNREDIAAEIVGD